MINEQITRIETTRSQKETFKVLEEGNKVLKEMQREVNIERWERISEDMNEMKDNQNEIGEFLKKHNMDVNQFDSNVDKELEKLMGQEVGNELPEAGKTKLDVKVEEKKENKEKELVMN